MIFSDLIHCATPSLITTIQNDTVCVGDFQDLGKIYP